jgi:predicted nucleotidyltransferase component of viral defense system
MIDEEEIEKNAELFDVPLATIVKDHAISHALFCLSQIIGKDAGKKVLFYGGTALNRTHFTDFRLSEDIDLMINEYPAWIKIMQPQLLAFMRKVFPKAQWKNEHNGDGIWTLNLECEVNITIQIQCVEPRMRWEIYDQHVSQTEVKLRYSDLPDTVLFNVPSAEAFVAMKLCAWIDRSAARDLADLNELAKLGSITKVALDLAKDVYGTRFTTATLGRSVPPSVIRQWKVDLAHQSGHVDSPEVCYAKLLSAVEKVQ